MRTRILLVLLMLVTINGVYSQSNLNDYKYIIVLKKYDFLKSENQYNLNALTEFLFKKSGFRAIMEGGAYPEDLESNGCLALRSDVKKGKGLFKTKVKVVLKNCKNEIVYTSREGESREKNFKTSYHLALRDAFISFESFNHKYRENTVINSQVVSNNTEAENSVEVEKLKAEIVQLKKVRKETETQQQKGVKVLGVNKIDESTNLLYAQPIRKGFHIVNNTLDVVMILLETAIENTFVVKNGNAIVYKQDGFWYISKNDGKSISVEQLNIKF